MAVSHWWAEECAAMNHRAKPGELICSACGGGVPCTPEEYARAEAADREWQRKEDSEG